MLSIYVKFNFISVFLCTPIMVSTHMSKDKETEKQPLCMVQTNKNRSNHLDMPLS